MAERIHGFIRPALAGAVEHDHAAWDRRLDAVAFAYRSAPVAGSSHSPFYLMHGREPRLPGQLAAGPVSARPVSPHELVDQLAERLGSAFALARLQQQRVLQLRAERAQRLPAAAAWVVGDRVLAFRPARVGEERSAKVTHRWRGPFRITAATHPTYELEDVRTGKTRKAHAGDLTQAGVRPVLPSDRRPRYPDAVAPPLAGGTAEVGDLLLLALPEDTEPWRLARVEEEPTAQGTCKVHIFSKTKVAKSLLTASWGPAWFRPDTGEDVTADMPAPRLEAYHMVVPLSAVIVSGVTLTATGRLRKADVQRLSDVPLES